MLEEWMTYLAILWRENAIPKSLSYEELIKECTAQKMKEQK